MSSFHGVEIEELFAMCTEVFLFQGVGIEEFHYYYTEVSSFQGVEIEEFHCSIRYYRAICPHKY